MSNPSVTVLEESVIDIIIPIYRGYEETLACINSVLATQACNKTAMNVVVINDASPEVALVNAIEALARFQGFTLLHNDNNLGFVGTVNRGMSLTQNDVVLLNSDAEVSNNWLDKLLQHVSDDSVATVTPFSNNATLCSYPKPFAENDLPIRETISKMDQYCTQANAGQSVVIPTGVGFCMVITRKALDAVGLFDEEAFGKGYGEENDFCQKAIAKGFKHLHALDVFVWHKGSVSFSEKAEALQQRSLSIMQARYPDYQAHISDYQLRDPVKLARLNIALTAMQAPAQLVLVHHFDQLAVHVKAYKDKPYPVILVGGHLDDVVTVMLIGNTHPLQLTIPTAEVQGLADCLQGRNYRNALLSSDILETLAPIRTALLPNTKGTLHIVNNTGGGTLRYVESLAYHPDSQTRHFILYMKSDQQVLFDVYRQRYYALNLCKDGAWQLAPILTIIQAQVTQLSLHVHSMVADGLEVAECLVDKLPTVVTLHDHFFLTDTAFDSHTITADVNHVLRIQKLLEQAVHVITPSRYLLGKAKLYFNTEKFSVIPHGVAAPAQLLSDVSLEMTDLLKQAAQWQSDKLTVAVVGAVGIHKGMNFMDKVFKHLMRSNVQCVHIGYTSKQTTAFASLYRIQHGPYHHAEIPVLLKAYHADVVLFVPGIPESFCYALSDIYGVLPVIAPLRGALGERVIDERLGTIYEPTISPRKLKQMILERLQQNAPLDPQINHIETMVFDTEQCYIHVPAEDWAKQKLTQADMQHFCSENFNEENLKLAMIHLARENYHLRQRVNHLNEVKKVSLIDDIADKSKYVLWRLRHYGSRALSYGPMKTIKIVVNRLRGLK